MWKPNNYTPQLAQKIKYKDQNGIVHVGIFHADTDFWLVADLLGGLNTPWSNVIEWQSYDEPALLDVWYMNWLVAEIESELA